MLYIAARGLPTVAVPALPIEAVRVLPVAVCAVVVQCAAVAAGVAGKRVPPRVGNFCAVSLLPQRKSPRLVIRTGALSSTWGPRGQ